MNKAKFISHLAFLLLTGCGDSFAPSKAELAEKEKAAKQKTFQDNLAIAQNTNASTLDRLRALDKVGDVDEKLANEIRKPIIDEMDRKIAAQQKTDAIREKEDQKRLREEKKRKKKEGITIGMTMQDVLDSAWGRPQHKTTYHTSMGEHTIWQYGEYGERGTISFENGIVTMIQN